MTRPFALLLLLSSTALAQTGTRRVRGTVYDSIGHAPLAAAVVEVVMVDPARKQDAAGPALPSFAAVTDSAGHFEVTGLPAGLFAVGFQHQVLNALGIEAPIRALDLRTD